MPNLNSLPGFTELRARTRGDSRVLVAVLDGEAAIEHPAYSGANVVAHRGYWLDDREASAWSTGHATHIGSVIFGQPGSTVEGLAPDCRGMLIAGAVDEDSAITELNLARAIEYCLAQGARIIHCAFAQPSQTGMAQAWIEAAVQKAEEYGAVIVAPAGNDYGEIWCSPATLPTVVAVGALADDGAPMQFTNFGSRYDGHSIMGPGENVLGATPDGGVAHEKGTSVAAPVITGVIAALTSAVVQAGGPLDPQQVRQVLFETARPCTGAGADRCIGGEVAVDRAIAVLLDGLSIEAARRTFPDGPASADAPPAIAPGVVPREGLPPHSNAVHYPTGAPTPRDTYARQIRETNWRTVGTSTAAAFAVEPSLRYPAHTFVIGQMSVEYPNESVRRVFADAMGSQEVSADGRLNDIEQLVEYLDQNPADARKLNWVVNINGEPRYRVRPSGTYANEVFDTLAALVLGSSRGSITVASIPGSATADTTTLQSGTVVRDLTVTSLRGIHGWHPAQVAEQALTAVHSHALIDSRGDDTSSRDSSEAANAENRPIIADESTAAFNWPRLRTPASAEVTSAVADFLQLAYFRADQQPEVSRDRALNFAATNGYQIAAAFLDAMNDNLAYSDYRLEYSPFARVGGNCWDLILCFRDPVKGARAIREYRLTVDVVDTLPVTVGRLRSWAGPRS